MLIISQIRNFELFVINLQVKKLLGTYFILSYIEKNSHFIIIVHYFGIYYCMIYFENTL